MTSLTKVFAIACVGTALPNLDRMGERQPLNLAMPWGGSYALEGAATEVRRLQDDLRTTARKFGRTRV